MPKKREKSSRRKLILFFAWSLLIHVIIIVIFFLFAFEKKEILLLFASKNQKLPKKESFVWFKKDEPKKIEAKQDLKNELPASLKPRRSEFGVTDILDETPQFTPPRAEILAKQKHPGIKTQIKSAQVATQDKISDKQKQKVKQNIEKTPTEKFKPEIKEVKQEVKTKAETKPETKKPEIKKEILDKAKIKGLGQLDQKEIQEKIKKIEEKQLAVSKIATQQASLEKEINLPKTKEEPDQITQAKQSGQEGQQATEQLKTFGHDIEDKGPMQRPKKSIIAMTKGFIENLKNEGTDWLERKGDDNKRPTFEEMKYISYEQKINWNLQNSWKQNFEYRPWQKILEGKAVVEFKITDNGNVQDIKLLESTGIIELDDIIIKSVHFAAPFPPLPKHFETNLYTTGRIIYVNARKIGF